MATTLAEVEQQARQLSATERAKLAELLLESLNTTTSSEVDTAWQLEVKERVAAYENGETEVFAADQVFTEARQLTR